MSPTYTTVPVPAPVPEPPVLSLLSCSLIPPAGDGDDDTDYENISVPADIDLADLKAELVLSRGEPWLGGFGYLPRSSAAAVNRALNDYTTVDEDDVPPNEDSVIFIPFAAFTKFSLTALDYQAEDWEERINDQLDAAVPQALENEFWTGTIAQANDLPNNYLASSNSIDVTPVPGTAVSVLEGLGKLQTASKSLNTGGASLGSPGMIHVMPEAVPNLLNSRLTGKYLLDMFGNIIVPGVGYPGTGPTGESPDAGTTWMYFTDMVTCRVQKTGRIFPGSVAEATRRPDNTITFRGFKIVAATFDGARQYACLVNLPS
jgi:hypothetical protein